MGLAESWQFLYYVLAFPVFVTSATISAFCVAVLVAAAIKQAFV